MQEARLRSIGLPLDDIARFPLPIDLPPRERGERGIKLMRAGYLGPRHNFRGPDEEATEILFDTMARTADPATMPAGTTLQWRFPDAEPWHLVLQNTQAPSAAGARCSTRAARGLAPEPSLTLTSSFSDFVDLSANRADPRALLLKRRLRPSGDLRLLLRLPKLFG